MHKKVVFYLLTMVVFSGLITFGFWHYRKTLDPKETLSSISWGNGTIIKSMGASEKDTLELLKTYSRCSLSRGIPLELEQKEPGVFEIKKLSPFKSHSRLPLKEGDLVLGHSAFLDKQQKEGVIKKIKEDGSVEDISYEPEVLFYCMD